MSRKSGSGIRHPFPRLSLISYPSHDEERGERSVTRDPETGAAAERHTSAGHGDALGIRIMMEGAEEMRLESEQENLNRGNQSSRKK